MSSFKNFAPMLTSLQAQADGTGTIAGSPLEDFLSIAGYETPGGGGGGGGSSIVHPVNVTIVNSRNDSLSFIASAVPDLAESAGNSGFYVGTGNVMKLINQQSEWLPTLQSGATILPTAYILEDTAIYIVDFMSGGYTYSIVGDAIEGEAEGMKYVAITGDCTITIS